MMPNQDGLDFLKEFKSNPEWKHIPFIFLTNIMSQSVREKANRLGADGYLIKPETTPEKIVEEINKTLATLGNV